MAKNNNLGDFLKGIADKIRTKLSSSDPINPQDFEDKIDEVYESGKDAQYDEFWDAYQNKGKGDWGSQQFYGRWWNDSNFYPKYDIRPGGGDSRSTFMFNHVTNLRERIDGRGLKVILPQGQTLIAWFREALTTEVPSMDTSLVQRFDEMFYKAANLVTIPKIDFTSATSANRTFTGCKSLQNITFEGTTKISLDLGDCPLTGETGYYLIAYLEQEACDGTRTITIKSDLPDKICEFSGIGSEYWNWVVSYYAQYNWTFALI